MTEPRGRIELCLPDWIAPFIADWQRPLHDDEARMELAVALSSENVKRGSGGPFGAIVVDDDTDRLAGYGVNLVTAAGLSIAHAEMVAFSVAQTWLGTWDLSSAGRLQLVTSCEPCAMCYGAIPWSGVSRVVCGAGKADAEAVGFDEGPKPDDWQRHLQERRIEVRTGVLRAAAAQVLKEYAAGGGSIYNAKWGE